MRINIFGRSLLSGALFGTLVFARLTVPAATFVQTINEASSGDWTQSIWGSPTSVASAGNSYIVPATFFLRTINTAVTPQTFAGDSLIITNGGTLYLKHAGAACTVNLVLDGGQIIEHGGGSGSAPVMLGGTLQVNLKPNAVAYNLGSDQGGGPNHDIWLQSNLSGNGNLIVNMLTLLPNTLALYGTNSAYAGSWTNNNGTIEIRSGSVNALGSGSVTMSTASSTFLSFNTTNDLVISNSIYGSGQVLKLNTNTVTLYGTDTYTGATTISNGVLRIGPSSSITNSSVISLAGGTLDASLLGGLVMNSAVNQSMNCNGTVIGDLAESTGNTNRFALTSSTNNILNVMGALTLNGAPTIAVSLSGFKPPGTYRLINYSGTIQGGGSFALVPPAGSSETFGLDYSTPGQVNLVVAGAVNNLTWVGDGVQNNWDTSSANWSGGTNVFSTGDNVTFNDSGSAVPNINFAVNVVPGSITVSNTAVQYIFGVVGGPAAGIVTSGSLTKLGTNEVDFVTSGNNISGPMNIQGGVLSIGTGGSTGSLGTGPITNNGILRVNMGANGVALNAPISGSGSLEITGGGATVTIGGNNSYAGLTTIGDGCQLNIAASNVLGSAGSGTIVLANGRLGVASAVGATTVPEPVVINGTGISGAPGALYVNTSGNNVTWAGPITVASASQIRAVNPNARMNFSNTVLGTNVALECTAGNTVGDTSTVITFQNTVSLGSLGSFNADGLAVVVLAGNTNVWGGGTAVANGTLLVNGQLDGGTVMVTSAGTLGGSGTILGPVSVNGSTLAPGNSIGTLTISNSVTLDSSSTNIMELNRNNTRNADLLIASSLNLDGTLTVVNIGPALQAGDTFQLYSGAISGAFAVTNLPALTSTNLYWDTSLLNSGIIKVSSSSPSTPPPVTYSISGGALNLSWPGSYLGWIAQSNSVNVTATNSWFDIAGSQSATNLSTPINRGLTNVFYRLRSP